MDHFNVKIHDIREGYATTKEGDLNCTHPFPRVSGYKRGDDITKRDVTDVRVYCPI